MPSSSDSDLHNRSLWDHVVHHYLQKHLHPSERTLLERWRGRWHEVDMLDLGVGGGRTAHVFAAITRRYVGPTLDWSPAPGKMLLWLITGRNVREITFQSGPIGIGITGWMLS